MNAVAPLPITPPPLNIALVQDLQWAMDRLAMVYREALSTTVDPERERSLLKSINSISRYPVDADLHDERAVHQAIEKANAAVSHFKNTGALADEYRVD